ncbi:MAG: hypothetical protein WCJ45_06765 [bacterium]
METKTEKKSVFIICSVRKADAATQKMLVAYKQKLESQRCKVHLPHLDTNQYASGYEICLQNTAESMAALQTYIFYDRESEGVHFDIGVKFVDAYIHPEKEVYVMHYLEKDPLGLYKTDHLQMLFEDRFGGYEVWRGKLKEMMREEIISIRYLPNDSFQYSHIALGMAFALCRIFPKKCIKTHYNRGIMHQDGQYFLLFEQSFGKMIVEWEDHQQKK